MTNPTDHEFEQKLGQTATFFLEQAEDLFNDEALNNEIIAQFGDRYQEFWDRLTDEFIDRIEEIRGGIRKR